MHGVFGGNDASARHPYTVSDLRGCHGDGKQLVLLLPCLPEGYRANDDAGATLLPHVHLRDLRMAELLVQHLL